MARVLEKIVTEVQEIVIDGGTYSETVNAGRVIRATPKTGGSEYIRLHFEAEGTSFLWNDLVANYDSDTTDHDPATEARWVQE